MTPEPKRIDKQSADVGVGGVVNARFGPGTGTILRRLVNYHNIWGGFTAEPQNADANCNGSWILWMKRDTNTTDPVFTEAEINSGDINMVIIACGLFVASNETPYMHPPIHLNSSRNLVANQEMVLTVRIGGVTAGLVSVDVILCAGLSVK